MVATSRLAGTHTIELLNLTRGSEPQGGRASLTNVTATLDDARTVFRTARRRDVVHIHSAMAPTVTLARASTLALAARARGARVVVHAHGGLLVGWADSKRREELLRLLLLPAHRVVAVAESVRTVLAGAVEPRRLGLISNGVDVERFTPRPEVGEDEDADAVTRADAGTGVLDPSGIADVVEGRPPRVLYAGLLTPRKGVLDLFQASRDLRARDIDHELCVVGGTPDEGSSAEQDVRRAAAATKVTMAGSVPSESMADVYRHADVFCLASWWEAMPLTVLEAMASGLPVVATDVGDNSRLVVHGETGLIVPPRDPRALAEALARLLDDAPMRRRFGQAGRARVVAEFSLDRTIDELDTLYASVGRPLHGQSPRRTRSLPGPTPRWSPHQAPPGGT